MYVPAFHTRTGHSSLERVWHDREDCAIAQGIPAEQRVAGCNNAPRCSFCRILDGPSKVVRPHWSRLPVPSLFPILR